MICTPAVAIAERKKNSSFSSARRLDAIPVKKHARQHRTCPLIPTRSASEAAIQIGPFEQHRTCPLIPTRSVSEAAIQISPFDLPIHLKVLAHHVGLATVFSAILVLFRFSQPSKGPAGRLHSNGFQECYQRLNHAPVRFVQSPVLLSP
jgi:hypothetical protein